MTTIFKLKDSAIKAAQIYTTVLETEIDEYQVLVSTAPALLNKCLDFISYGV